MLKFPVGFSSTFLQCFGIASLFQKAFIFYVIPGNKVTALRDPLFMSRRAALSEVHLFWRWKLTKEKLIQRF